MPTKLCFQKAPRKGDVLMLLITDHIVTHNVLFPSCVFRLIRLVCITFPGDGTVPAVHWQSTIHIVDTARNN